MNVLTLQGRIGGDPEGKTTPNGASFVKFSLATTDVWYDKQGQKQERTEWHNCVLWGNSAEAFCRYVKKGDGVCLEARLTYNEWTDQDGRNQRRAEVKVHRWHFGIGSGRGERGKHPGPPKQESSRDWKQEKPPKGPDFSQEFDDDDIPF